MDGVPNSYEGRQDLGDGDGSLIKHIEEYHAYYENNEQWDRQVLQSSGIEALEADKEQRAMLLNEFVPYLKLHCNLSEMELIAGEALQAGDNLTPTETAYHTAMQAYVAECRGLVNQGEYNLPPVPQLKDFDVELAAYKEHVKEEIAQEAAAAGMSVEEYAANGYEPAAASEKDTFSIYQLKHGDETRDLRFEPYDRLQAAGNVVDRANYELVYSAELTPGTSLEDIYTRFNIDHPKDFKGHSLSVSDVVVLHQNGQDAAHYVDSFGYKSVPEFLQEQKQLTPDGQRNNPLKAAEQTTEQNYNMIDGVINNTPTVDELEAKVKAGETISLVDLANAVKADKEQSKSAKPEKKPSIRAQLRADKEKSQKKPAKQKSQDLERS